MPKTRRSLLSRFISFADIPDGCWIWNGALSLDGYSQILIDGKAQRGHRLAYELFIGPIPNDLEIDHLCKTRACVNPKHLRAITHAQNIATSDCISTLYARRTVCLNGHPFTEANTYWRIEKNKRSRRCRICAKEYMRNYTRDRNGKTAVG